LVVPDCWISCGVIATVGLAVSKSGRRICEPVTTISAALDLEAFESGPSVGPEGWPVSCEKAVCERKGDTRRAAEAARARRRQRVYEDMVGGPNCFN
jgi:hypothetical protein